MNTFLQDWVLRPLAFLWALLVLALCWGVSLAFWDAALAPLGAATNAGILALLMTALSIVVSVAACR